MVKTFLRSLQKYIVISEMGTKDRMTWLESKHGMFSIKAFSS